MADFNVEAYGRERDTLHRLEESYCAFRAALFEAAGLPAEPDGTWGIFIEASETYRAHLIAVGAHDVSRCLYCRQPLNEAARSLIVKYSECLKDKIIADIAVSKTRLHALTEPVTSIQINDTSTFADEYADIEDKPHFHVQFDRILNTIVGLSEQLLAASAVNMVLAEHAGTDAITLGSALDTAKQALGELRAQATTRAGTLAGKKKELVELGAAAELTKSRVLIESHVHNAKQADRPALLAKPTPRLLHTVTELAKTASDQMINESFDVLFNEECAALRTPALHVEFVGRQGRAQCRKILSGRHRPSRVLSEGEQRVLAIADSLAETRLAGIIAPVIFNDLVSSLDHRRISEVAQHVASLANTTQVIVFIHDIFFASTLLTLMEATKHCSYSQITDEEGKGKVTRATGPR